MIEVQDIVSIRPDKRLLFLEGPAGAGKTTLATQRLCRLIQSGVSGESILVWAPQRALLRPYEEALWELDMPGGQATMVTVGGLARRMLTLFWPLCAARVGFAHPERPPTFLTLETTQYYMERVVSPLMQAGYFDGVAVRRNRLCSQLIDNLNKAATMGFLYTDVAARLKAAWSGASAQHQMYDQAQAAINSFRALCLEHSLLDFSLQMDVFFEHLLSEPVCWSYLTGRYRHLIVDNIEEDTPRSHSLLKSWLPVCETALIVMDQQAGYRVFLSADPRSAAEFKWLCQDWLTCRRSWVMSPGVTALGWRLTQSLGGPAAAELLPASPQLAAELQADVADALRFEAIPSRFQPQMVDWVAEQVADLIQQEHVPPEEIVILSPFLSDALRFALENALARRYVFARSHRPSRALREEPAARCLLTLACLGYPMWMRCPDPEDVAHALMTAIDGLDLIRARLLCEIAYRPRQGQPAWSSFQQIETEMQERIQYRLGERFERLRRWLSEHADTGSLELDAWIGSLFQDVLSRPGFGFYGNLDAGRVVANLIESVHKFRQAVADTLSPGDGQSMAAWMGLEYVRMVEQGVIAATFVSDWQTQTAGAVLMAPAYTFLMSNRPVDVQFWLDIGSDGWWERLNQPLTHPYVLSPAWPAGKVWSDQDEFAARQMALGRLLLGLMRRCRKRVYLGIADLGEQGYELRGPLLQIVQRMLRRM